MNSKGEARSGLLKPDTWSIVPGPRRKGAKRTIERKEWTREEDAVLRKNYTKHGSVYTARLLGRNKSSVQHRALRLGIPGKGQKMWATKEIVYVRNNYPRRTAIEIARTLRRTEQSVRAQIRSLGLTEPASRGWNEDEIHYLRKHYGRVPNVTLAEELGRSVDAVEIKAGRLGLSRKIVRLTSAQMAWVRENVGRISYHNMARTLGVSDATVMEIAHSNGYRPKLDSRPWTEMEDDLLRRRYGELSNREIAAELQRTPRMVSTRAVELGLAAARVGRTRRGAYSAEEDKSIRVMLASHSLVEIAEALGRSYDSIAKRIQRLGLQRRSTAA